MTAFGVLHIDHKPDTLNSVVQSERIGNQFEGSAMAKTEQKMLWGFSGAGFATEVNQHLAEGWRVIPGTISVAAQGGSMVVFIVLEREAPAPASGGA